MNRYTYISRELVSTVAIAKWEFESHSDCRTSVLPDGCRDVIIQYSENDHESWFISDLSQTAYSVSTTAGMHMRGMRLLPGVEIRQSELHAWMEGRDPLLLFEFDQLNEFCSRADKVTDALDCLAAGEGSVVAAAKELGVSLRSLERLIKRTTGESPYYWLALARIRRAGRSLVELENLSDAAAGAGFADQSHMNREMKKWFQRTPGQLKQDTEALDILFESGYG